MTKRELIAHNIVLLGDFNTRIFHPLWFSTEGLLRDSEARKAEIEIIHKDITIFQIDWLRVQITPDRFSAATTQELAFEPLRDLVIGTFRILYHTPLRMMGINFDVHFRLTAAEDWAAFESKVCPDNPMRLIFTEKKLQTIVLHDQRDYNEYKGQMVVKIEPSNQVQPGIYINTNDHYGKSSDSKGSEEIISILEATWSSSKDRAFHYHKSILELI